VKAEVRAVLVEAAAKACSSVYDEEWCVGDAGPPDEYRVAEAVIDALGIERCGVIQMGFINDTRPAYRIKAAE
jgi:hypothetical protein